MGLVVLVGWISYILWQFWIVKSFNMLEHDMILKQYTFYYKSYHYHINWTTNNIINITDYYNNTILFDSHILTINSHITIDYQHNDNWNEIHTKINTNNRYANR